MMNSQVGRVEEQILNLVDSDKLTEEQMFGTAVPEGKRADENTFDSYVDEVTRQAPLKNLLW